MLQENSMEAVSHHLGVQPEFTSGNNNSFIYDLSRITYWEKCTHRQKGIPELGLVSSTYKTTAALVFPGLDFFRQLLYRWK